MYIGLAFSAFLLLRLVWGFVGPRASRFSAWVPYTRERLGYVRDDLRTLLRLRMPEPATHRGLNGLVQSLGLLLFTWQGASGALMALLVVPGERTHGWLSVVREVHHEWGGIWIPAYLVLHVGAAVLHALTGRQIWKKMIFLPE
jgi:cytochrome b